MTAEQLVPGISRFPELARQLTQRLGQLGVQRCQSCAVSRLALTYQQKLRDKVELERLSKGRR